MNLSALFISRPIATILLTIGLALAGAAAFFLLPVSPLPQVDFPTIQVRAALPGASPETMATSVATPLEKHLGIISDVSELTSSSRVGQTNITLQFGLGRNIDGAARDVQAAINAARVDLPITLRSNPTYRKQNPADAPILILSMTSKTRTPGQIYDVASTVIQQQLSQIKGVGSVEIGGSSLPAVRVELNITALAKQGIGLEDVRAALASANANRPKGILLSGGRQFQIYTNDTGVNAAAYAPLVIAYRNGNAVRLADIAQVTDGVTDIHNFGLINGQPAVVVVVSRQPAANIIDTVDRVKAVIPRLQRILPADIDMKVVIDRTITIRASLAEVERTVLISVLLVIAVVAFFLRNGRAVLIPSVAVSVSLLGAIGVMFLLHFSLDNLSLMALTVATGFVVDDAIVVMENITRHVEAGMSRVEAALLGAREVGFTVLSISISLIAVFIPILLMGGIVGRLFREFAITLSAAILVSLVISLTTTPMMCAFLVDPPKPREKQGRIARWSDDAFSWMQRRYEHALDGVLDAGPLMLVVLAVTVVLTGYLYVIVPKGFFPTQDTGQMQGGLQSDQSSSFALSNQRIRQFVRIIRHDPSVATVVAFTGGNAAGGFLLADLKPRNARKGGSMAVIQRLRPKLARVVGASLFLNPAQDLRIGGRQAAATYQFTLEGPDLTLLRTWAGRLADALKRDPTLTDVNTDQEDHGLESFITVNRDTTARLGITNTAVDNTLYDAFGQRQVSTIYRETNQYKVVMEAAPEFTRDPTALHDIYVSSGSAAKSSTSDTAAAASASTAAVGSPSGSSTQPGSQSVTPVNASGGGNVAGQPGALGAGAGASLAVGQTPVAGPAAPPGRAASQGVAVSTTPERITPLSAIASWADTSTPTAVNHQDTQPATTISFSLAPGKSLSDATKVVAKAEAAIGLPTSLHGAFQGTAKVFQESLASEPLLILAAIVAIYLVLGVLYESYVHPLTVLSTLPSAGIGALIALIVLHIEFTLIALIGVILLIGIVKKNAILMIDFALAAERDSGLSARDAIRQAALTRFRPIMMTTFAAILGAVPLAIGGGEGSELRQPLGVTIIGGLLISQVITLLTTPVVYLYLDRFNGRRRRAGSRPSPMAIAPNPRETSTMTLTRHLGRASILFACVALSGCLVGPNYRQPSTPITPVFKEAVGWVAAQPSNAAERQDWWTAFGDPTLDALEARVIVANQTIAAAEAAYRQAVAVVRIDRAALFPTISTSGSVSYSGSGGGGGVLVSGSGGAVTTSGSGSGGTSYRLGLGGSWAPDLFGGVRRTVESARDNAQASAANLANARLLSETELALDYVQLRQQDEQLRILDDTTAAYARTVTITGNKYNAGVSAKGDLLNARSQLSTTQAQAVDLIQTRARLEHAIAILTGEPPDALNLVAGPWKLTLADIPSSVPSTLLQRRPDIAAAERGVAAANALIGVQIAAYYPSLNLTGSGDFASNELGQIFNASSFFYSVGASAAETLLDFGARRGRVAQARAAYDQSVANYRQTVLTAFEQVEDDLASQRVFAREQILRHAASADAAANETITRNEYSAGLVDFTTVVVAQANALNARTAELQIEADRLATEVDLITALGGGWSVTAPPFHS